MAEDLLKKYHLEETRKRMKQLYEYTFYEDTLNEEGEDDPNNQGGQMPPQQPPMDNDMNGQMPPQQPPMDNGMNGQMPPQQPPTDNGMNDQMPPQQPPTDNGMNDQMPPQQPPMDDGTMDMTDGMDIDDGTNGEDIEDVEMEGDDEVIDVDDLTQSQETTEYKVDGVDEKLTTLLDVVTKFADALEKNDQQIQDLRHEIEKRNPTEQEKLNIRSQASSPYGESPKDFWTTKMAQNPHYNVIYDNDVPADKEDEEFEIRKNDVRNGNDMEIYKSLDKPLQLKDVLDFD